MTNPLAGLLLDAGRQQPGKMLLRTASGEAWTYADLDSSSSRFAHVLDELGVRPGDRVAVQAEKSPEVLALHVACVRAGAVYLPMNTAYTERELADLVDDAQPSLLVRDAPFDRDIDQIGMGELTDRAAAQPGTFDDVSRRDSDPAAILYTSGTTGRPKGAVMSQGNLVSSARTLATAWGFTRDDVLLHALPLFHTHGLFVAAYCTISTGGSMVMLDAFDPGLVIDALPACTVMMGVPTHYTRLLASPDFTAAVASNVRLFTSGSAPMLLTTHEEFRSRTGRSILERYGMTETCMLTSNPLVGDRKPGTVGLPLPGVRVRVAGGSPGAVEVTGPNVFDGYWRRPELRATEFTSDGWFKTGDIGRFDADGYLEIVGRSKDLVITGGLNVYPKEVEQVLDSLPGVRESAVFGLPDPDFGEAVTAVVVALPDTILDADDLRLQARQALASFKVPKRIHVLADLPRNAMGKVEKARLREAFTQT